MNQERGMNKRSGMDGMNTVAAMEDEAVAHTSRYG